MRREMSAGTTTQPVDQLKERYDGVLKVTGTAKYAAEFTGPFDKKQLAYAFPLQSTVPSGTIAAMDTEAAEKASGVLMVMTPFNAPKLVVQGKKIQYLQDNNVYYNGQFIALVIARSLVEAKAAAKLITVSYKEQPAKLDMMSRLNEARAPKSNRPPAAERPEKPMPTAAAAVIDQTYITPVQNHNPMEPHATIAWWENGKLTVYDATQGISGVKTGLAKIFGVDAEAVHVMCPYLGGGFGTKGSMWSHTVLAAMAAQAVKRPVKLVLDRTQMFGPVGARPSTINHIQLAAGTDGKLLAVHHHAVCNTSMMEDFLESSMGPSGLLYACDNIQTSGKLVEMNWGMGTWQRAPGEAPGTAVTELAMDELAHALKIDPLELRLINYTEGDPERKKPFSSKHLRECYKQAAEKFGWSQRNATPGQMREGDKLIGYGMATATYPANRGAASAVVRVLANGHAFVGSGTQDLGTGMYTIMAQTAADKLGMDPKLVEAKLGDTTLPKAGGSGGSTSTASVLPAVAEAALTVRGKMIAMALKDAKSPLFNADEKDVDTHDGRLFLRSNKTKGETFTALIARNGGTPVEAEASTQPTLDRNAYTAQSFGAVFAEVAVDEHTHMVQVRRVVATYDIGILVNNTTGLNQLMGGVVWGVGFALHEETMHDPVYGRVVNENLADYHVPVNPDIGTIDVSVLNIPDFNLNPLGVRGIGEIGITGAMAAVGNAIFNATGKRVREYPMTPDKIMRA
jgi:xanthine dehydrogenase YagR molybdenum-binding subunit